MPRWLLASFFGAIGIALGLVYGWIVDPVRFVDTTPASLRSDFRADFVLMTAESFHQRQDSQVARRELAVLGGDSPAATCSEALTFAQVAQYAPEDVSLLQELSRAMQTLSVGPTPTSAAR
jgi:hypothetical protein